MDLQEQDIENDKEKNKYIIIYIYQIKQKNKYIKWIVFVQLIMYKITCKVIL